jgi:hypothetical protein
MGHTGSDSNPVGHGRIKHIMCTAPYKRIHSAGDADYL